MEPLDENQLNQLLRKWDAPPAPPTLRRRVLPGSRSWWNWLWRGSIRVPVPVALAAAALVAPFVHYWKPDSAPLVRQPSTVSLADFKPVPQLQPILVSGGQK